MKTILVPTELNAEHGNSMLSALDAAFLLAQKFGSCIEGFALRPAVADMVAMDPDAGLTMVAVKENDAEMARQAEICSALSWSAMPCRAAPIRQRKRVYHGLGFPTRQAATTSSAAMGAFLTSSCWRGRKKNGRALPWSR